MKKIYLARGDCGRTDRSFNKKIDAKKYLKFNKLDKYHLEETDGVFDGLEEIELW